jgi:hypothetical protein
MCRRCWIRRVCALLVFGCANLSAAADGDWYYTIDQAREQQQANFCHSSASVEKIAGIFEGSGPRAGYSALSGSADCTTAVHTFTPRRVLRAVTISEGKPGEYVVRFVEVEKAHGQVMYLVTTRDVVAQ